MATESSSKRTHNGKYNADLILCGLVGGILQGIFLNPWDQALYLSIKNERKFIDLRNFVRPMRGLGQNLVYRAFSFGLYFPLEDIFRSQLHDYFQPTLNKHKIVLNFAAGTMAGMLNGILLNPVVSIRYYYWGRPLECQKNFFDTAYDMFNKGGVRPFFVGSTATLARDFVFGGLFALLRHELDTTSNHQYVLSKMSFLNPKDVAENNDMAGISTSSAHPFSVASERRFRLLINLLSACVATVISSPLNYVRNINYATPPEISPHSMTDTLKILLHEIRKKSSNYHKFAYTMHRLTIGWGTARVGVGMAIGSEFYHFCSQPTGS